MILSFESVVPTFLHPIVLRRDRLNSNRRNPFYIQFNEYAYLTRYICWAHKIGNLSNSNYCIDKRKHNQGCSGGPLYVAKLEKNNYRL